MSRRVAIGSAKPETFFMAGHSKFKNIMHRKGRADAQRSKLFSKLSRDITVAAKSGMPDPAMNPRLRLAVMRSEERRVGKECDRVCRSRWSPYH